MYYQLYDQYSINIFINNNRLLRIIVFNVLELTDLLPYILWVLVKFFDKFSLDD